MIVALKRCTGCRKWKSLDAFSKMSRNKDGRQPQCKECAAAHYATNRDAIIPGIKARRRRVVKAARMLLWEYLSSHPCIDCGETDPIVLDFDHVTDVKRDGLSTLASRGHNLETIKREIAKCVVRCANCHRRRTAKQFGWYQWLSADEEETAAV